MKQKTIPIIDMTGGDKRFDVEFKDLKLVAIQLKDVWSNPFRDIDNYELDEEKVEALMDSIEDTGFWNNVIGRIEDGYFEMAYGHHRLEAAKRVLGEDHIHLFPVADIPDFRMLQIMAMENRDDWGNSTKHNNLTVEQGRDYLDTLLDQYPTWEEACRASEFGGTTNLESWFGDGDNGRGSKTGPAAYANCVKNGVGTGVLVHFFKWKKADVEYALRQLDPSDKQLAKLKAEEEKAAAELAEAERKHKEKKKNLKAGVVDATLTKAKARKEKLDKQLAGYNPKAGEVFDKPIHADAFKKAVTLPVFRKYLPEKQQVAFAKKVKKACGREVTAKGISEVAWSILQNANKELQEFEEAMNPWDALETRVRQTADNVGRVSNDLKELIAAVNKAKIQSLSGSEATRLKKNLDGLMERVTLFYDTFGMEPPMVEVVKNTAGKTTNLRVVK